MLSVKTLPIKTGDIVNSGGNKYVVRSVKLTSDGPILELLPITEEPVVMHASEVSLADNVEATRRGKSIGVENLPIKTRNMTTKFMIELPDGITQEQVYNALTSLFEG